jgi:glutaminyl-peptide cyclotransferase
MNPLSHARSIALVLFIPLLVTACNGRSHRVSRNEKARQQLPLIENAVVAGPKTYTYDVVKAYPHDAHSFTQGLVYEGGSFYESAGQYGESNLRKVDLMTGNVLARTDVGKEYFAEGLAKLGDRLFQLTWKNHKGFIYNASSFEKLGEFQYDGEGWGLTTDGRSLILSDGTNRIRFLNPDTFKVDREISVNVNGTPLTQLNELEYVNGEIFANIWETDKIVRLDPANGKILGWVDLTGLLPAGERTPETNVLNGIAYDPAADRLFVTGKRWPKLYEIKLRPKG